ncbi:aromatic ring-hydroxylating dioxygenase subunit alpha [Paraburkholderia sp. CNPSo 3281]|uniref:aromatic ring-hydroxylating dioxygenase subunit alpha n=1 Tax=Paraburkholderia sp. CNPSo 3281 TaxID=2940933 RepID=UPI0020B6471B|nr:aromatic ring-hydroxylating dioxygenase subunit alpha [Paraburkholderia sp. CNPSo 3281]MCP3720618.1 aromatic ring-hydroxylating dioxygenase subunit alpha [Paraburkholderia sp. CNPSo 3281]
MYVRNCWYVAAWDYEVPADSLFERQLLDESILLYRKNDGGPVALSNSCCHRKAPLSLGRKEGDCVRCMYHGMKFDHTGHCVEIPGQQLIPAKSVVRSFPVVERNRWIWIWMGDPSRADESLIPDTWMLTDPNWRMKPGYMAYEANYLLITDNLLDFSHLSYVHEKTLGGSESIATTRAEIERIERGVRVKRRVKDTVPAPYQRKFGKFLGNVDRWFHYDFLIPGILLMESGVKESGKLDDDYKGALHFGSCQAVTPASDTRSHYFFMQSHAFALDDAGVTEALYEGVCAAFNEDRRMIEAQQNALRGSSLDGGVALAADSALMHFRRMVETMSHDERADLSQVS